MKVKTSLHEVSNAVFFDKVATQTLRRIHLLNQKNTHPRLTFGTVTRNIILQHAKKDPHFFEQRFNDPDDIDLCAEVISLCIEEMLLKFLFSGHMSQLEHFEEYEKTAVSILQAIAEGIPVDTKTFLGQCNRLADTNIRTVQLRNNTKPLTQDTLDAQARKVRLFIQRSDVYYLFNTFLSANIGEFAECLLQRKRLERILRFQLRQQSWENVDRILSDTDPTEIRDSLPPKPLFLH